ncbi:MAG: hypothetical protein RIB97_00990 [Nitratireductor sp.]
MLDRLRQLRRSEPSTSVVAAPKPIDRLQAARNIVNGARDLMKPFAAEALAGEASALAAIAAIDSEVSAARRLLDLAELAAEAARDDREAIRDAQRRQSAIDSYNSLLPGYRAEERDRRARLDTQIAQCRRSGDYNQAIKFEELRDDPAYCRIPAPPPGWCEAEAA